MKLKRVLESIGIALALTTILCVQSAQAAYPGPDSDTDSTGGSGWYLESHVKGWYTDQNHYSSTYHKATRAVAYTIHYDGSIYLYYKGIHDSTVVYEGTVSNPDPSSYVDMAKGVTCTWAWSKAKSGFYDWFWNYHWIAEIESSIAVS